MLIAVQSVAIQVNGLSAGLPRLMSDFEGQPVAEQQTQVTFISITYGQSAAFSFPGIPPGASAAYDCKYLIK